MFDAGPDDAPLLPCPQALIAGTVALMTSWADPVASPHTDAPTQQRLIARKIVSNLFFLQHHPALAPALRQVMGHAHARWAGVAAAAAPALPTPAGPSQPLH